MGGLLRVFDEGDWERAVYYIKSSRCTPFIGAGASTGYLPLARDLAGSLAREHDYPFDDVGDLARVSQFAAVKQGDRLVVKMKLADDMFANVSLPDFRAPDEPYGLLADLGLPLYVTTNYDDFIYAALEDRGRKPLRAICPWYTTNKTEIEEATKQFQKADGYAPGKGRPIVYHLHGHHGTPESMVLTEDDYIDFLVRVSRDPGLLPPVIQGSLGKQMLLFIGYSLADSTFRVIFRGLLSERPRSSGARHVSVQLPPSSGDDKADAEKAATEAERLLRAQEYLDKYFEEQRVAVCWQEAREFTKELRRRWEPR